MKIFPFLVFLASVLSIYILTHLLLFYQTRPVFGLSHVGILLKTLFWFIVLSYPVGRFAEIIWGGSIAEWLVKIGSVWLAFMLYLSLLFLLTLLLVPVIKLVWETNLFEPSTRTIVVGMVYGLASIVVLVGYLNAISPVNTKITIETTKNIPGGKITIAAVSDIHLGTIIGKKTLIKMADAIQSHRPDIIFLVGDIFDEDIAPVINGNVGSIFSEISSRFPVYAITGNHEFIRDPNSKINFLRQHGVTVLLDSAVSLPWLNLIGRTDRQNTLMNGSPRLSLSSLTQDLDTTKFTVVLDHQPYNLTEAVEANIDLQLSGHTHHGQLFPFNFITQAIFEISRGYQKKGNTHVYVSTGYGTWGPRVRVGNKPEIVFIDLIQVPRNRSAVNLVNLQ